MAAVGGALSLYLGIALILCFELIELAFEIAMALCSDRRKRAAAADGNQKPKIPGL